MEKVLKEFMNNFCLVYIDDIIVFSEDVESHFIHLSKIFKALEEVNLKLGYDKCNLFTGHVELLGHMVKHGSYTPLASRVEAI